MGRSSVLPNFVKVGDNGFAELRPNYSARQRCAIRPNFGTILSRSGMYNVEQSS